MKAITNLWRNVYLKLGQVDFGNPHDDKAIKTSMRPKDYPSQANMILANFPVLSSVLEIGCGYGGLANEILNRISVSYTVVENRLMLNQAKRFLGDRAEYVAAAKIKNLRNREFTLFISNFCLSETPFEYREYVINNILKNCKKAFIIDYRDAAKPTAKMKKDGWDMDVLNTEKMLKKYFSIHEIMHSHARSIFIGERKK